VNRCVAARAAVSRSAWPKAFSAVLGVLRLQQTGAAKSCHDVENREMADPHAPATLTAQSGLMPDAPRPRYSPPGYLADFDGIEGQLEQWSKAVSSWFDESIAAQASVLDGQPCQYYNQLAPNPQPPGPVVEQEIVWNAFPGNQLRRWGRDYALVAADRLLAMDHRREVPGPLSRTGPYGSDLHYRPQDEYCEWRVERDAEGHIQRVTFTSEPPEYWQALSGLVPDDDGNDVQFTGDRELLRDLYREYVDPHVELDDLLCGTDVYNPDGQIAYRKGWYNPYNRWNTTHGMMHLTHPSNTLRAEIRLGADATVLYSSQGHLVADPDTLIARAGYGGSNRCSDPTIGASVNHLAALGYAVTLADPVGLYMDHLDMTGFTFGDSVAPIDPGWFTVIRGAPGRIARAVFEVPATEKGTVSDVKIAGEPIAHGGQLAERTTVKLVAMAGLGAHIRNRPVRFGLNAFITPSYPQMVESIGVDASPPRGAISVFNYPEALSAARITGEQHAEPPAPRAPSPYWGRAR
jgi:hypothetical protein